LGKEGDRSSEDRKSADWKIAIAGYMKTRLLCRNGWLADRLAMGTEFAVSRYVSEMQKGQRKEAEKQFEELIAKVKD
jgi:hypothetical protein